MLLALEGTRRSFIERFIRVPMFSGNGVVGAFEATPMATIREVFETNTFGVMAMTQAVLPLFRERRSGVVVNVTSSVTLARMPLAVIA
jgi:short-subunit dehydrogenase